MILTPAYLTHRADVDAYVQQADVAVERIQQQIEANYTPPTRALRARLRATQPLTDARSTSQPSRL